MALADEQSKDAMNRLLNDQDNTDKQGGRDTEGRKGPEGTDRDGDEQQPLNGPGPESQNCAKVAQFKGEAK